MPTYPARVITLRNHRIRDSEAICHFYSEDLGKIEAAARGIGKPGSKLTPATELFTLSRCLFAEGRNLDHLTQCEVEDAFYSLRLDIRRMGCAAFAVELVDKTTEPGEESTPTFQLLHLTLTTLCDAPDPRIVTWAFQTQYLALIGLGAQVDACVSCGLADDAQLVAFSPGLGGALCRECAGEDEHRAVSPAARRSFSALRRLGPAGAARLKLEPQVARELGWMITEHRRFHVDADIRSARFLSQVEGR